MVSAESWIRSATSSMVLISEWICSRSSGVMKVLCSSLLTSIVTRSAACSARSTSWLYFVAQYRVGIVPDQLGEGMRGIDHVLGMLVEQFEEVAFARHQFPKDHVSLLRE